MLQNALLYVDFRAMATHFVNIFAFLWRSPVSCHPQPSPRPPPRMTDVILVQKKTVPKGGGLGQNHMGYLDVLDIAGYLYLLQPVYRLSNHRFLSNEGFLPDN